MTSSDDDSSIIYNDRSRSITVGNNNEEHAEVMPRGDRSIGSHEASTVKRRCGRRKGKVRRGELGRMWWRDMMITMTILLLCNIFLAWIRTWRFDYHRSNSRDWILVGGLTPTTATFKIRNSADDIRDTSALPIFEGRLVIKTQDRESPTIVYNQTIRASDTISDNDTTQREDAYFVMTVFIEGLTENTGYYYEFEPVKTTARRNGQFHTPVTEGNPMSFTMAASGCAWTGSKAQIFESIAKDESNLQLFLHMGDMHYEDHGPVGSTVENMDIRMGALDRALNSPEQLALYSKTAFAYMYDDHDWLGNNVVGNVEGRTVALRSYRVAFPVPEPLPAIAANNNSFGGENEVSPYHAFTIGLVRFIMLDLRAESNKDRIYSTAQQEWLFGEISNANAYDFVILLLSRPWIGEAKDGDDSWLGYAEDRAKLSAHISETVGGPDGKGNLLAIASDAHMVAFDDGRNTFYGHNLTIANPDSVSSFPILVSGPLDRFGSIKGGAYSAGCFSTKYMRNHQYSAIDFDIPSLDDVNRIPCLTIRSYYVDKTDKDLLFTRKLCGNLFQSKDTTKNDGAPNNCKLGVMSSTTWAFVIVSGTFFLVFFASCCISKMQVLDVIAASFAVFGFYSLVVFSGWGIPYAMNVPQFDAYLPSFMGMLIILSANVGLAIWAYWQRKDAMGRN
mmetsp:Transcript_19364/g.35168  ORF Transcript_19364/g.35168 Transcript_19364/m.35168 type:complete len:675 (-) Transcript_19364:219-2243(-)